MAGGDKKASRHFFLPKNGEGRRKSSLHCAVRHNFTQKTKFFLHIFTKFQKPCLLVRRSLVRRWMKSLPEVACEDVSLRSFACHGVICGADEDG